MKNLKAFGCIATVLLASACAKSEELESEDIRTSGIYPEFTVTATGNGQSSVNVVLKVAGDDSNTTLELTGKDKLVCTAAGSEKVLKKSGTSYRTTFPTDASGTEFKISLERGEADETAPDSHVKLPSGFALTGVTSNTEVSRSTGEVTVTWEASEEPDSMTWTLDGECLFQTDGKVSEDGRLTLQGDDFDGTPSADSKDAKEDESKCEATLCVERKLVGSLDRAFKDEEGGEIRAIQRRCTRFISTP